MQTKARSDQPTDPVDRLWALLEAPWIDPAALRAAVEGVREAPDHRTATLLEEASLALQDYPRRVRTPPRGARFPYLWSSLMEPTDPGLVKQMLRELGEALIDAKSIEIGGSIALMWKGLLSRHTQDVDAVDEIPAALRQVARSRQVGRRYSLKLTTFQSHYLPDGWRERLQNQGTFGKLLVRLVDPLDVMTSKLFSKRTRDLDDLRVITQRWSAERQAVWREHVLSHARSLRRDPDLERIATSNWYILFDQPLFAETRAPGGEGPPDVGAS
jgi:hypothetical protein